MMMKNNTTTLSTTATTAAGDAAETSTGVVNVARSVSDNGSDTAGSTKSSSTTSMGILRNRYSSRRSSGDNSPSESGKSASISIVVDEAKQQKQNRKVCMLRTAMILTLVSATVIVAVLVYKYVKRDERNDFETQYEDSVSKVQEAFQYGIDIKHDTASAFSSVYTSQFGNKAQIAEPVWPNATLTHFEEEASDFLTISNGRALSFNPIITQGTNRLEWEAHAAEDAWRFGEESLVIPPPNTTWPDNRTVEFGIYSRDANKTVIYDPGYAPESRYVDVLIPVWQIYPITEKKAIMFNLHSEKNRQRALDDMIQYQVPTLTAILQLVQDPELRPSSILFYPVFDDFEVDAANRTNVVGSISIVFSWDTLLEKILPNYIKGMICVLRSSVSQEYSYSISGNEVIFLGEGDLHDLKYDKYRKDVNATLGKTEEMLGQVDYLITYNLVIYPSQDFENAYSTNRAVIYTAGVVLIFLCTSALFILYDYLVEDRQQKTARLARQSANIVDSLFPAGFRERLYSHQGTVDSRRDSRGDSRRDSWRDSRGDSRGDSRRGSDDGTVKVSNKTDSEENGSHSKSSNFLRQNTMSRTIATLQIDKFMNSIRSAPKDHNLMDYSNGYDDKPIADLFLDTSIMFADIVGFTKWSSERSPNEVFRMLERLFWEFDELAASHNVFKLGTIGDCYIAVTGIPEPIEDHATVLAQFSFEARDKVHEVFRQLEAEGLDTVKLDMRFGIHSGAITAGILRGTKSRFELFGDTINTASRMESTSIGGKIQVSADTAELIRLDRKGKWLTKRNSMITAKGKGQLQTYWIERKAHEGNRVSFMDDDLDPIPDTSQKFDSLESDRCESNFAGDENV